MIKNFLGKTCFTLLMAIIFVMIASPTTVSAAYPAQPVITFPQNGAAQVIPNPLTIRWRAGSGGSAIAFYTVSIRQMNANGTPGELLLYNHRVNNATSFEWEAPANTRLRLAVTGWDNRNNWSAPAIIYITTGISVMAPTVTTLQHTNLTASGNVTINGNISRNGGAEIEFVRFIFTHANGNTEYLNIRANCTGDYWYNLVNLPPGRYSFVFVAGNWAGTSEGITRYFTIPERTPENNVPQPPSQSQLQPQPLIQSFAVNSKRFVIGDNVSFNGTGMHFQSWKIEWLRGGATEVGSGAQHGSAINFSGTVNSTAFTGARLSLFPLPNLNGSPVSKEIQFQVFYPPRIQSFSANASLFTVGDNVSFVGTGYHFGSWSIDWLRGNLAVVGTGMQHGSNINYSGTVNSTAYTGARLNLFPFPSGEGNPVSIDVRFDVNEQPSRPAVFTAFSQHDSRWGQVLYTSTNNRNQTISTSGCGLLSITNAVYNLNGNFINPIDIGRFAVANGHRTANEGTAFSLYRAFANNFGSRYGFRYSGNTTSFSELARHLQQGGTAVISVTGHVMAIAAYNNGNFMVLESAPNSPRRGLPATSWVGERRLRELGFMRAFLYSNANQIRALAYIEGNFDYVQGSDGADGIYTIAMDYESSPPTLPASTGTILSIGTAHGSPGDIVYVPIEVNRAVAAGNITVGFKSSMLELIDVQTGNAINRNSLLWNYTGNTVLLGFAQASAASPGTIAVLRLRIISSSGTIPITVEDVVLDAADTVSISAGSVQVGIVSDAPSVIEICTELRSSTPVDVVPPHAPSVDPGRITRGDVDGNGVLDARDAMLILRYSIQLETLDERARAAADVLNTGRPTALDALEVLRHIIGLPSVLD